jgi:hypothetical protein
MGQEGLQDVHSKESARMKEAGNWGRLKDDTGFGAVLI